METTPCPIREHEARFEHLREVLELRIASADRALALQSVEYQRRLDELNHAAERMAAMRATFVDVNVYRVQHAMLEQKVDTVTRLVFIGVGAVAALQLALHYWK